MTAFTIIMPAYNAASTLPASLASVAGQTETDLEVIVVDDGSTDATASVAASYLAMRPNWRLIRQANGGPAAARNAALEQAQGRWIALLDADDWLLPGYLHRMRELLESASDIGLAFCDAWVWQQTTRRVERRSAMSRYRPRPVPTERWAQFDALAAANFVFVAACFPRTIALELGGFNESLRAAEEWEMWLRILAAGHRLAGVNDRLAVYRRSPTQASADRMKMRKGRVAALTAIATGCNLPPAQSELIKARIQVERRNLEDLDQRHALRKLVGAATRWAAPVRDFRLRVPAEVARVVGVVGR